MLGGELASDFITSNSFRTKFQASEIVTEFREEYEA